MQTAGLSLEQAPHLSIPASFFLAVPVGMLAAGSILVFFGAAPFASQWNTQLIALTHVGTIGVLLMGMLGALYQMTPVIAGTPVPAIRLAHGVHGLLLIGLVCFAWRMLGGPAPAMSGAALCLGLALVMFVLPVGRGLARSATRNETVLGMRLAVASLAIVTLMGLLMARGYAGAGFPFDRFLWTQVHLALALLGWVGGLIMAVSWQVVPMFYLAPPAGRARMRLSLVALVVGLVLPFTAFIANDSTGISSSRGHWPAIAALPAALTVWFLHPLLALRDIARRKRRRSDASLLYWRAGLVIALTLVPLATATLLTDDDRLPLLLGWLAIWGWAGMIMHGMLNRIVPFLVWFHRITPLIGKKNVPSMRGLLSQRRMSIGFGFHLVSIVLGAAAVIARVDILAQATGILLVATGISLGSSLDHVLRKSWR